MDFDQFKNELFMANAKEVDRCSHANDVGYWYGAPDRSLSVGYHIIDKLWTVSDLDAKGESFTFSDAMDNWLSATNKTHFVPQQPA